MKKIIFVVLMSFALVSCSNSKLEEQVKNLESDNKDLQNQLEQTKKQLETAQNELSTTKSQLEESKNLNVQYEQEFKQQYNYSCTIKQVVYITDAYHVKENGIHYLLGWQLPYEDGFYSPYGYGIPIVLELNDEHYKLIQMNHEYLFTMNISQGGTKPEMLYMEISSHSVRSDYIVDISNVPEQFEWLSHDCKIVK